jgi:hypothetical protein
MRHPDDLGLEKELSGADDHDYGANPFGLRVQFDGHPIRVDQKTVFETSFDFALSPPLELTALTAKYHVPGLRGVVYVRVFAPMTLVLDEYVRGALPQYTLYPVRSVNTDPSTFCVGAVQLSTALRSVTVVIANALPLGPVHDIEYV